MQTVTAQQSPVVICTEGSSRWEGKIGKLTLVLDGNAPAGPCRIGVSRGSKELFAAEGAVVQLLAYGGNFGADRKPGLAFETGPSTGCCWTLYLVSVDKSAKVVGKLENGAPFTAHDEDKDGVLEFWTRDGALVGGFDGVSAKELADQPSLVIQWGGEQALDISSRFPSVYDSVLARLEAQLTPEQIASFRQSDGKLDGSKPEGDRLRSTKATVLEIVWALMYSGRDGWAWEKLAKYWPEGDVPRIRKQLVETRDVGVRRLLVEPLAVVNENCPASYEGMHRVGGHMTAPRPTHTPDPEYSKEAQNAKYQGTVVLWAMISPEGCIHEARVVRSLGLGLDEKAIEAVRYWKFEPSRKDGVPVPVQVNVEMNFRLY
ncbi:MAG: energy transducer TonB [Acidobacteriota bacterium]|nr:energy transducer TonB [Acidobacteriota bacterium]